MAETLKRLCKGEPLGGTGLLEVERVERLERVERESKLARDSREDWRELKDKLLASSSICREKAGIYKLPQLNQGVFILSQMACWFTAECDRDSHDTVK